MTKSIKMMVYDGDLSSEVWLKLPVGRSFVPLQEVLFEHVGESRFHPLVYQIYHHCSNFKGGNCMGT